MWDLCREQSGSLEILCMFFSIYPSSCMGKALDTRGNCAPSSSFTSDLLLFCCSNAPSDRAHYHLLNGRKQKIAYSDHMGESVNSAKNKSFGNRPGRIERTTSTKVAGSGHGCRDETPHLVPTALVTLGDYGCSRYILSTE